MPLIKRKPKFNLTQFTQNLKAAEIRARQAKNKSDNSIPFLTQEVALNIQKKDVENAQVKAEALIKAERLSVALEELGLILEEVTEKATLLLDPKSIPDSFLETLSALIYAIPRVDVIPIT